MNNHDPNISLMINGRSYFLSSYGEPYNDGSRSITVRLNHNSLCQMMQQDGDDETCTCLEGIEDSSNVHPTSLNNEEQPHE